MLRSPRARERSLCWKESVELHTAVQPMGEACEETGVGAALGTACRKNLVSREACSIRASMARLPNPGCDSSLRLAGRIDQENTARRHYT